MNQIYQSQNTIKPYIPVELNKVSPKKTPRTRMVINDFELKCTDNDYRDLQKR